MSKPLVALKSLILLPDGVTGSTTDSDSVSLGSNPNRATKIFNDEF